MPLRILYEKYGSCLTQDNMIKLMALLIEYQTGDIILGVRDIYIKNPDIKIRVRASVHPHPVTAEHMYGPCSAPQMRRGLGHILRPVSLVLARQQSRK